MVVSVLGCALLAFALSTLREKEKPTPPPSQHQIPVNLTRLPISTTNAKLPRAPLDRRQDVATTGLVVHPVHTTALFDKPNGKPFAKVQPTQFGDTWLPAIERTQGWIRVLLPSKPNGSTGWLQENTVTQSRTTYLIRVHLGSRTIELYKDRTAVGVWRVAMGKPATPTPTGRTFVLGQLTDPKQRYSPVIIPLGFHSQTLDSYGGGPGTVALHGWPDPKVFGQAISHGCIRVPAEALQKLSAVPIGTVVLIDNH